jgi:hypothetical protein
MKEGSRCLGGYLEDGDLAKHFHLAHRAIECRAGCYASHCCTVQKKRDDPILFANHCSRFRVIVSVFR